MVKFTVSTKYETLFSLRGQELTESLDVAVDTIKLDSNFEKSVTYHFELKKTRFRCFCKSV